MKLPKVISTRDLQRNIGLLATVPNDEMYLILKTGRIIGVYTPIELFKSLDIEFKVVKSRENDSRFSEDFTEKLKRLDLIK